MKKLLLGVLVLSGLSAYGQYNMRESLQDAELKAKDTTHTSSELDCSDISFPNYRGLNDVKCAIKKKWNLNKRNSDKESALIIAARRGHIRTTRLLVGAKGVNLNARDEDGKTALIIAAEEGHYNIANALIEDKRIDVNLGEKYFGETPLMIAVEQDHMAIANLLFKSKKTDVNKFDNEGFGLLDYAIANGKKEVIELILNKVDKKKYSAEQIDIVKSELSL